MAITHALVGASLGAALSLAAPVPAAPAMAAGFLGGALPDVDLLWTHRRTLHVPVVGPVLAIPAVGAALASGFGPALLAAAFLLAWGVHSGMDLLGGGVEVRPWEASSEKGVYDHVRGRWIRPRRWVRYSGAPEDLLLAAVAGLPAIAVATGATRAVLAVVLVGSAAFVAVRRRLAGLTERLFSDAVEE